MSGPKIIPRDKTPRLGRMINGKINFPGKKTAAKNKQAFTIVPTSHCRWLKEKGIENDKIDKPIKTKTEGEADKITGKFNDWVFWSIN